MKSVFKYLLLIILLIGHKQSLGWYVNVFDENDDYTPIEIDDSKESIIIGQLKEIIAKSYNKTSNDIIIWQSEVNNYNWCTKDKLTNLESQLILDDNKKIKRITTQKEIEELCKSPVIFSSDSL